MARWASANLLSQTWRRAKPAWRALPRGTMPRLVGGMLAAWLATAAVVAGLTLSAKSLADNGLADWDYRQTLLVRDGRGWASIWPLKFTDAIILESPANLFILIPLTALAAGWSLWRGRVALATAFVLHYALARFLIWLGWGLWDRARPQVIENGAAALSAHSFPSGHVILAFTTYGLLAYLWMAATRSVIERVAVAALLLLFATVIGYARLRLGAHWASDCLAGGIAGIVWLTGTVLSLRWAEGHAGRESGAV